MKSNATKHRIYTTSFASVYPHYVTKAEKKKRTKAEVDDIIRWLTGYNQKQLEKVLDKKTDFETFFVMATIRRARNFPPSVRGMQDLIIREAVLVWCSTIPLLM